MTKKLASLNVSVEAIVVLVLAITILGLGLAFIKNMFGKTTGQLAEVSDQIKEQVVSDIKSSNERLAFYKTEIEIKKGEKKTMYFGVRNDLGQGYTFSIDGAGNINSATGGSPGEWAPGDSVIACYDAIDESASGAARAGATGEASSTNNHIIFKTFPSRRIEQDAVEVLTLEVSASSSAVKTTYSCAIIIKNPDGAGLPTDIPYARKDFYVTVI